MHIHRFVTRMTSSGLGKLEKGVKIKNELIRVALAEFLGTFILLVFGLAANAQVVLSRGQYGSVWTTNFAWGMAVAMAFYVAGGVSGAHINPALTVAMTVIGKLSLKKMFVYVASQYLGAFVASLVIFGVYFEALNNFDGGIRATVGENATAGIWSTYPQEYISVTSAFFDQVLGTAMLLICICGILDSKNMKTHSGMIPVAIGFCVVVIGTSMVLNCGGAINPARDLSPRIFTILAGWGLEPLRFGGYMWWWVPVVGPHVGGIIGAVTYQVCVGWHWPDEDSTNMDKKKGTPEKFTTIKESY